MSQQKEMQALAYSSVEKENLITVTNNLDELTQIHADSNFIKLVKKSSDYSVKPK